MKILYTLILLLFAQTALAEITYPVDVANTTWFFYNTDTQERGKRRSWPNPDGSEIPNLPNNIVPLLRVINSKPSYDPNSEGLSRSTEVDVANNTYTYSWNVVTLTAEEAIEAAETQQRNDFDTQISSIILNLRNGTGTNAQRLARVEKAVAYILKDKYQRD